MLSETTSRRHPVTVTRRQLLAAGKRRRRIMRSTPHLLRSSCRRALALPLLACRASALSTPSSSTSPAYDAIQRSSTLLDPITGNMPRSPPIASMNGRKSLVVLLPQLGEFDSSEYVEFLVSAMSSPRRQRRRPALHRHRRRARGQKFSPTIPVFPIDRYC